MAIKTQKEVLDEYRNRQVDPQYYSIKILLNNELFTYENVSNLTEGSYYTQFDAKLCYGTPVHMITEGRVVQKAIRIKD